MAVINVTYHIFTIYSVAQSALCWEMSNDMLSNTAKSSPTLEVLLLQRYFNSFLEDNKFSILKVPLSPSNTEHNR